MAEWIVQSNLTHMRVVLWRGTDPGWRLWSTAQGYRSCRSTRHDTRTEVPGCSFHTGYRVRRLHHHHPPESRGPRSHTRKINSGHRRTSRKSASWVDTLRIVPSLNIFFSICKPATGKTGVCVSVCVCVTFCSCWFSWSLVKVLELSWSHIGLESMTTDLTVIFFR